MLISSSPRTALALIVACWLSPSSLGAGRVLITEIMYNPNSKEDRGQSEWIEIANVGDETVEIKNWRIDDEDKWDWGKFSCTLEPGGVAVLFNADYLTEEQFRAAWDSDSEGAALNYQAIGVKWGGIANTPGPDNEILQLLDDKGEVLCEVKQEGGGWPECNRPDGPSIYLVDLSATNLSDSSIWKKSVEGVAGGRTNAKTEVFNGNDIGSPGFVPGLERGSVAAAPSSKKPAAKPAAKPSAKPGDKPAASQPTTKPDNKIDY